MAIDPEFARLIDDYGQAQYELGAGNHLSRPGAFRRGEAALAAINAHLARHYARVTDLAGPGFDGPIPADPPDTIPVGYRAARGAVPWRRGMPAPEEAIRRRRDREVG